jgi:hypothetical protein
LHTHTIKGYEPPGDEKFYRHLRFEMPPGVTRLDVRYEYSDAIGSDPHLTGGNTVDIGLFDWRGSEFLKTGFRGWTGSARDHFYITPTGATPGYIHGPLTPGTWYICLGFYKVGPNGCHYTVTIHFEFGEGQVSEFPAMLTLNSPNAQPVPHPSAWYKGELHCHSVHSDGDSTPPEIIARAETLGLDFLAITDHNNLTHLMELQSLGPQNLILIPGCEVTTFKGHWNVWGLEEWVDFRVTTPELMAQAIRFAVQRGYLTSCNHPRPYGPPWDYEDVQGYHCVEVWNGPWWLANHVSLEFWEKRLRAGQRLVAVGGSDMHRMHTDHHAHLGTPTTWIHCPGEPTSEKLLRGLRAGHAFITHAPDGPQLYLFSGDAMMGDTIPRPADGNLSVQLRVMDGENTTLQLCTADGVIYQRTGSNFCGKDMTQVNQSESDVMSTKEVDRFAIITNQQSAKLVNPSETAFTAKALGVDSGIEQAFTPTLGRFAVALIFGHVGDHAMIKTDFAGCTGIKGTIGIEQRPTDDQPQTFHHFEGGLKVGLQTKSVVMMTGHDAR